MTTYSYDRRQASTKYELVYQSGGTGGPYDSEDKAKTAAERLLKGGSDRWIAVIDAKHATDLVKAKALWLLKRGGDWEKGPRPLPNVRPMDHFKEARPKFRLGDRVEINKNHGFKHWHGDTGTIDKFVPINKCYVNMDNGDRRIVDLDDLDPA